LLKDYIKGFLLPAIMRILLGCRVGCRCTGICAMTMKPKGSIGNKPYLKDQGFHAIIDMGL
jgi:hypothetical protein